MKIRDDIIASKENRLNALKDARAPQIIIDNLTAEVEQYRNGNIDIKGDISLLDYEFITREVKTGSGGKQYIQYDNAINWFPNAKFGQFISKVGESKSEDRIGSLINRSHAGMDMFEMAKLMKKKDGYGIEILINSDDHEPAHAHVIGNDGTRMGKFLITDTRPTSHQDIISVEGFELDQSIKRIIVDWAQSTGGKLNNNNWDRLIEQWDIFH